MFVIVNEKTANPIEWLERHGDYLYAFALSRLHNETLAEDFVQETLLAALESHQNFSCKSSEKTWLCGIMKHKIIDYYRRASRQISFASETDETDFFDEAGAWRKSPTDWNETPESLFEQKEFQAVLREALANLPKNLSAVFTLREIEGLETKEICEILNLSPNNLWVLLHRARLQLRQTIERRWFGRTNEIVCHKGEFAFSSLGKKKQAL